MAKLFRADGRMARYDELNIAFRNFAKAPNNVRRKYRRVH
jgi:hypothetical protein